MSGSIVLRRWALAGAAAAALVALPYLGDAYVQQVGYRLLQLIALALAWNLLAGYGGLVSLGTAAFVGLGAYAMAEIGNLTGAPPLLLIPVGGLVAAALAVLLSPAMFRMRGLYFTVGSLAMAEALRVLVVNLETFGGASGLILQAASPPAFVLYWLALAVAAVAAGASALVLGGPFSLSLRSVRDDEDAAREVGVDAFRVKLAVFALAGFLMGLVGAVQALKLGAVEPYGAFGMGWTIDTVAAVMIGGLGTRHGPVVGAVFYVALGELLKGFPELHEAIAGVVLLAVIRFAPKGLSGLVSARLARPAALVEFADG